jgi:hypothetical protein
MAVEDSMVGLPYFPGGNRRRNFGGGLRERETQLTIELE